MARDDSDSDRGVYAISVAAELVGLDQQSLRLYEQRQLLTPDRTEGGTRRYSDNDLERLRRIRELLDQGINLAGVGLVLDLQDDNTRLQHQIDNPDAPAVKPSTNRSGNAR